ncbi:uncharacterized protein LOC113309235 [Papaver somniferum]|uniref:uncharacterized protein LOC113309235 n=1 Tax=Papaver somniferum TaxID=3469 RepID=UPI000E6FFFF6|nr:uncharacterized protein LOC113309235 [Papaver somniferum]
MLLSMNVFDHQTTRPKLLHFPSSCHGRRIQHKPPVLVSFPAKTEFNPKFLHPSRKSVLVSCPATMKFRPVLFASPRDNEEFSSDNEEEEHGGALILSDNGEYAVREAELDEEFWASASLKTEGLYKYRSQIRSFSSYEKEKYAKVEYSVIIKRYMIRHIEPFMCIIAVRKEGENLLQNVIGTLDLRVNYLLEGETYPEELVKRANLYSTFKERGSEKCGIITNVTVAESARQQGVGSSMLKFAIEAAKEEGGVKQVFLQVRRDNEPALALYRKMGFEILAEATPRLEEQNLYLCSINL